MSRSAGNVPTVPPTRAAPRVEIVVVSYKSRDQLEEMLTVVRPDDPLVIVDNASGHDRVDELLADRPAGRYLDGGGQGFAKAANLAARTSDADILIFANPDSRPTKQIWDALVADLVADVLLGASAAAMLDDSGRIQLGVGGWEPTVRRAAAFAFGLHKKFPKSGIYARPAIGEPIELEWLTGACLATRRDTLLSVGGFDERYFVYNEDMALGRALREAGFRQSLRTDLLVPHSVGGSGAGSVQMWRMRGASLASYLHHHNGVVPALTMRALLIVGMVGRSALSFAARRRGQARLYLAYVVGMLTRRADVNT